MFKAMDGGRGEGQPGEGRYGQEAYEAMDAVENPVLKAIYGRRSVREFQERPVARELILEVIRAGSWAPSGLNNQPWRFAVVTDPEVRERFVPLTKYSRIVRAAPVLIPVFLEKEAMYHQMKDHQAAGACIQNMLLAAHSLGLGAVWLGEIIKSDSEIREILGLGNGLELQAVVAMGHPVPRERSSRRRPLDELVVYDN